MGFFDRFKKEKVANNTPVKSEKETMTLEEMANVIGGSDGEKIIKLQMLATELAKRSTYNPTLKEVSDKVTDMIEKLKSADVKDINNILDDMNFDISMLMFDLDMANAPDIILNTARDLNNLYHKDVTNLVDSFKAQREQELKAKMELSRKHDEKMAENYKELEELLRKRRGSSGPGGEDR